MRRLTVVEERRAATVVCDLLAWYERHGRHDLPWRTEPSPYRVLVSEFMLQQTQVDRVLPLFASFVSTWPGFATLAAASVADVVRAWKGLGYNSRAVRLHALARTVTAEFGGELPSDPALLAALPGIGPYTLAAVSAFAFDRPVVAIDTNLRRIFHRVGYGIEWPPLASPVELEQFGLRLAEEAGAGFALNSALMDLGASLCTARTPRCLLCPLQRSCAAAPIDPRTLAALAAAHAPKRGTQATLVFEQTTRYLRGRIVDRLRAIDGAGWLALAEIEAVAAALVPARDAAEVAAVLDALARAGLVERSPNGSEARLRH